MSLASVIAADPLAGFCISHTLPLEGGLVDNPADPGGVTSRGVSLRWALQQVAADPTTVALLDIDHDGDVDRRDIMGLTQDEVADIYYGCWWRPGWYQRLAPELVAWKCFDVAVNTGPRRAALILQAALGGDVVADGVVGPSTIAAAAAAVSHDEGAGLLAAIRAGQAAFYQRIVYHSPASRQFLKGWLRRAAA